MPFSDFKSNVKAIKSLNNVSIHKKSTLLLTQMQAIELLLLDKAIPLASQDIKEAQTLYNEIETYRKLYLIGP